VRQEVVVYIAAGMVVFCAAMVIGNSYTIRTYADYWLVFKTGCCFIVHIHMRIIVDIRRLKFYPARDNNAVMVADKH
jgi:hypothetical protein